MSNPWYPSTSDEAAPANAPRPAHEERRNARYFGGFLVSLGGLLWLVDGVARHWLNGLEAVGLAAAALGAWAMIANREAR